MLWRGRGENSSLRNDCNSASKNTCNLCFISITIGYVTCTNISVILCLYWVSQQLIKARWLIARTGVVDRCSWQQYWCSVDISIPNVICLPPAWSKHERFLHQVHSVCQIGLLYFLFIQLYALNSLILFKMFIIGNEVWIYRKKIIIYIFFLFKCWLLHKELCFFEFLPFLVDLFNFVILTAMIYRPLLVIYIYSPWTFLFDWRPVAFHQI